MKTLQDMAQFHLRCSPTKASRVLVAAATLLTAGCSIGHVGMSPALIAPPNVVHVASSQADELRALMAGQVPTIARWTADLRVSAKGPDGRLRSIGQVLLERPSNARLTLLLPFGPPAWLGVSNGVEMASWDIPHAKVRRAEASRNGIAELSGEGDLGLGPNELIALAWGQVDVPRDAQLAQGPVSEESGQTYIWRWQEQNKPHALEVDSRGSLLRLGITTESKGEIWVRFGPRNKLGLPSRLTVRLSAPPSSHEQKKADDTELDLVLTDVREVAPPTPNAFILPQQADAAGKR